ncbi:ATP-binding protein [Coralloluteibacterium thermophilus]|uniref:ATP-binding protein n=1 Tax=Coralloluteibacterium thermophilum TaxID=2707049 RepID=A0ABV9NK10_9GAMM
MPTIQADASPEKRLFISLLTRDIPLIAAFLDLIDNSINATVEPHSSRLRSADQYLELFGDSTITPQVDINISLSPDKVEITDTAGGICAKTAKEHVFKFGRGNEPSSGTDRLSVYGIGLKRALFKLGNKIVMRSDHVEGGFELKLDVAKWAKTSEERWTFNITPRKPVPPEKTGTSIVVTELYDEVTRRLEDGVFESQLRESIAKTYAYYLAKFVRINVGKTSIEGINLELSGNHASESFDFDGVSCAITAGIGVPQAGAFRDKSAGWFVFCNGRAVVSADKSPLTGWGGNGLPIFQPKHRPFLGTVFFVSDDPERLPWTTTKSAINEDSSVWQATKRQMAVLGRVVISFLDGRYTDEGTEIPSRDLQEAMGPSKVTPLSVAAGKQKKSFKAPEKVSQPSVRIQYDALVEDIRKIAKHLKRPGMSGSDVGRHTFHYFLRNEVESG